jgi:hypothetical protein
LDDLFGKLYMPRNCFFDYICKLEKLFEYNFERVALKDNTMSTFIDIYNDVSFEHPCGEFPHKYLIWLSAECDCFIVWNLSMLILDWQMKAKRCNEKKLFGSICSWFYVDSKFAPRAECMSSVDQREWRRIK